MTACITRNKIKFENKSNDGPNQISSCDCVNNTLNISLINWEHSIETRQDKTREVQLVRTKVGNISTLDIMI